MIDDRALGRVLPSGAVALLGDLIRATIWMLVVVALLAYVGVYLRLAGLLLSRPGENDFTIFYYTARMVSEGRPMYGDLPREYGLQWKGVHLGNLNPPHFQLLIAPLVPLGYRGALAVFLAVNAALVGLAGWLTVAELRPTLTPKRVLLTLMIVFSSAAWTSVAVTGEMSLVLLVPFTCAWIAARRGRWALAGVLLGTCVSVKLFFLVFAAWLVVSRAWRACAGLLAGAAASVAAGSVAFGVHAYVDWLHGLSRVAWWYLPMNVSLRGTAERVFHAGAPYVPVVPAPGLARPAWIVCAGLVAAVTAWRTWPPRGGVPDVDRAFPLLLVAALLVSPLGWVYYLPLATAPLLALALRGKLTGSRAGWTIVFAAAVLLLWVPMELTEKGQPSRLATLTLASVHGWGALLLWLSLVRRPAFWPVPAGGAAE